MMYVSMEHQHISKMSECTNTSCIIIKIPSDNSLLAHMLFFLNSALPMVSTKTNSQN